MSNVFYMDCSLDEAINRYHADQERAELDAPKCDKCGEPLGGYYYEIEDWSRWCENCADEWFSDRRHETPEE